jgi:hypothetical protein
VKDPATFNIDFNPADVGSNTPLCDCGWPYHMYLPRATTQGMKFKLMVFVTDAAIDLVGAEPDCGSLSFCGAQSNLYPDRRPLGYPFNRKFTNNTITDTIANNPNMASRNITIKRV